MALIPMPTAVIDDADVACALSRAVRVINPVVDLLSRADPFGLKGRSHRIGDSDGSVDKALDALAWVLNTADVPGTQAWADMTLDDRVNWWVRRVGAVDNVLVAFPGVLGAVADRLPTPGRTRIRQPGDRVVRRREGVRHRRSRTTGAAARGGDVRA